MDDISKVTNSILPTATELHSAVIKSLNEFDGNSYKKLKNNFKNYKGFTRILPSYIASIESVLEALTTNVDIDPSLINVVNNISENNATPDINSSKPTGLSIVDSINQVRSVVQGIQESVEKLADIPLVSPVDIMKMHANAYMIEYFLKDAFQSITKALQNSNVNYGEVNDIIGGTNTLEKIKIMQENNDSTESTSTPDQLDDVIKEMKSKDKVSVTEALTDIVNIIGQVLCMPLGFIKLLIFKRKIKKLTELLADSINTILNGLKGVNLIEFLNQMKLLAGAEGSLPLLNKSLDIISEIIVKFKALPKISMRKLTIILSSLANIQTIINKIAELEVSDETNKRIAIISNMVDNLKHIFLNIILLGLLAIPVMIASVALMASILFVSAAIWVISKVLPKEILLEQSLKKLIMIESIFWNLKSIYLSIAILGLLAIPLIIFFVPIMISILLLTSVLILLQWCLKAIKPVNIIIGLVLLNISIGLLIATAALLIILGLLGRQIIANIVNILITIGVVITVLLLFSGLGALAQFVLPFLMMFVGAVALIALSFVFILVIAALIVAIANIKITEQIVENVKFNVTSVFNTVGVIGKLIWDNMGSLLSMTAAVPLLMGVVAALIPITIIAAQLLLISKINIPNNISEKLNELFNVIIGTGEENVGSLSIKGFIKKIDESLSKKEVRRVKKIVKNIKNIIRNIYKITQRLNDIQNAKPDKEKIMSSLNGIFEVILGGKFGEESEKEFSLVNSILTLEATIENRDTLRRCNGILRNIENILGNLLDIIENINEIQNLKADKGKIMASLTDIFEIILGGNFGEESEKEFSLVNSILVLEAAIENRDTLRRCNGILRNIENILSNLRDIIEYLNEIQNLKADKGKIMTSLTDIFEVILGGKFGEESEKEFSLVNSILTLEAAIEDRKVLKRCNGILKNIENILSSLSGVTNSLNSIKDFDVKGSDIKNKLQSIFDVVKDVGVQIDDLLFKNMDLNTTKSWWERRKDRKQMNHKNNMVEKANDYLGNVGAILSTVSDITNSLNSIKDFDINVDDVTKKIKEIFEVVKGVGTQIDDLLFKNMDLNITKTWAERRKDRKTAKHKNNMVEKANDYLGNVGAILSTVSDITNSLNSIKDFDIKENDINNKLQTVFGIVNTAGDQLQSIYKKQTFNKSSLKKKIDNIIEITKSTIDNVNKTFNTTPGNTTGIDKSMEFMDASSTFVEKVQSIDNSKLIASTNAFKSMAVFAKTIRENFDELADSLNEKIAPLLEEMNVNLDKVNGSVKETSSNVATSVNLSNQRSLTQSQLEKQVSIENPNATQEQIRQEARERHVRMERIQLEENSIMQEILNHLKNGKLQVVYS